LLQRFFSRTGLPAHFEADDEIPELPDHWRNALPFCKKRLNLIRMPRPARHGLRWNADDEEICLTVQDDGIGISGQGQGQKGLGLQGMRERVTLAGGLFHLHSAPGQGTVITARFAWQDLRPTLKARTE
jgi:glucose-6-phosphate-specific signal transduction histidine kinase